MKTELTTTANSQNAALTEALATILAASSAQDGPNPILEALAKATGYELVAAKPATIKHRHNRCLTTSATKSNGQKKATAADPIRSVDDFHAIANYLRTHGNERNRQRNYTLYICGCTLGLRVGDLLRVTINDVFDLKTGEVRSHLSIINQKTNKRTKDLITPLAATAINELVTQIREEHAGVIDPTWPLFQSQRDTASGAITALNKSQVHRFLSEAAAACNVPGHISTHSMRKTYGYIANSTLSQAGVPAAQIMETLQAKFRHSDQATTMCYIGLQRDQMDATALSVDAALCGI